MNEGRALVVEDSAERQALLSRLLEGLHLTITPDGGAAIEALTATRFGIVFLDYDLADELTGEDVARAIVALRPRPPVVVHSMNPEGVERILALLPEAHPIPVEHLRPRSPIYGRIRSLVSGGGEIEWNSLLREVR